MSTQTLQTTLATVPGYTADHYKDAARFTADGDISYTLAAVEYRRRIQPARLSAYAACAVTNLRQG